MYELAVRNHQAGNLQLAEQLYRQVVQADSSHADAWCFLGVACQAQSRLAEAEIALQRAVQLAPSHPSASSFLGAVLLQQSRPAEAVAAFQQALRIEPDNAEIQGNLGVAYAALGSALAGLRKLEDAVASYRHAVRLRPQDAQMHYMLGAMLAKLRRLDEAITQYEHALRIKPDFAEAYNNLGFVLQAQGRVGESITHWRAALRLQPNSPEVLNNLGNAVQSQGNLDEAIGFYQRALQLRPGFAAAHNNLGNVLKNAGRLEEAVAHWRQALLLERDYAEPHYNLAKEQQRLGQFDEAEAHYKQALRLKPDYAEARWNRALLWLLLGDFERGWPEYEMRWTQPDFSQRSFPQPRWDGSVLAGRTIYLHAEQGLGDTLHFVRYVPLVQALGLRVILECQPALLRLLSKVEGLDKLVSQGATVPTFDVQAPLLSLPGIFRTSIQTIPATVPYLFADKELVGYWRGELRKSGVRRPVSGVKTSSSSDSGLRTPDSGHFRIGIAWQGSPSFRGDRERSIPLAQFAPLARVPGVQLISLQKGPGVEQLEALTPDTGLRTPDVFLRLDESSGPFMDTAAIMLNLDLVISSDSAVAHLAGALGVPAWVALSFVPDWRWLLEREDSPWYPAVRLFRQSRLGQWGEVFKAMAEELRKAVGC
jgi:tetratricopeptide (TPR) repeat protein